MQGFPAPASETERILRECGCPEPVRNCAHFGTATLYLDDWAGIEVPLRHGRFDVWASYHGPALYYGDDYDTALAAFYAEEAVLLGRGDPA